MNNITLSPQLARSAWAVALQGALTVMAAALMTPVWSQALPPAGQVDKATQAPTPVRDAHPISVTQPQSAALASDALGVSFVVSGFTFSGNAAISAEALQAVVAESIGQKIDIVALDKIAGRITRYYRTKGYTVARAYVPPQQSKDGSIRIAIIEGKYSDIHLNNSSAVATELLSKIIAANLCASDAVTDCTNAVVQDEGLERAVLVLKDLPGTAVAANIKPGTVIGTTDFDVEIKTQKSQAYSFGFDNYGNSATGKLRLNANVDILNPNNNGDLLSLGVATTLKGSNTGSIAYSLPAGDRGARVGVALARSQYRLGAGYEATQSHGTSNALSVFGHYPVIRSVNRSFYLRGAAEVRGMYDSIDLLPAFYRKNATVLRVGFSGDNVDSFGGGGYTTYGAMVSNGILNTSDTSDATGAKTAGRFNKLAYNIGRQQAVLGPITLYGSINGQWAGSRNLDGSEQIGIGGPGAVRGYAGEAGGSQGIVGNFELRHTQPISLGDSKSQFNLTSAVFLDRGWVDTYKDTSNVTAYKRSLGGYGVSLTLQSATTYVRAVYAGHPASEPSVVTPNSRTNFWLQAGFSY